MQQQFDCKEERTNALAWEYLTGHRAQGEMIVFYSTEDDKWQPVAPGSLDESLWKLACNRAKP